MFCFPKQASDIKLILNISTTRPVTNLIPVVV